MIVGLTLVMGCATKETELDALPPELVRINPEMDMKEIGLMIMYQNWHEPIIVIDKAEYYSITYCPKGTTLPIGSILRKDKKTGKTTISDAARRSLETETILIDNRKE